MSKPNLTVVPDLPPEPEPELEPEHPIDPRAVAVIETMPTMAQLRLFTALQALSMPKGLRLTKHFTRSQCAAIITEMTGLPANGRQKARPPNSSSLEVMLSWLIADAERKGFEVSVVNQIRPHDERCQIERG